MELSFAKLQKSIWYAHIIINTIEMVPAIHIRTLINEFITQGIVSTVILSHCFISASDKHVQKIQVSAKTLVFRFINSIKIVQNIFFILFFDYIIIIYIPLQICMTF